MDGNTIVQVTTIIVGGIVAVVTLLVRADVNRLKAEITELRQTVASAHALILQQNEIIQQLGGHDVATIEKMPRPPRPEEWTASPPYRRKDE